MNAIVIVFELLFVYTEIYASCCYIHILLYYINTIYYNTYTHIYTALAGPQPHLHPQQEAHQEPARGHAQKTGAEPTEHDGMSCIYV